MLRLKQRTSGTYTLTAQAIDDDGVAQAIAATYTVVIKDGAGVTVATGTPNYDAPSKTLTYAANCAVFTKLDEYSVTWGGTVSGSAWSTTDTLEICGGYLFEIADLRAADRAFIDTTKYPSALLRQVRTAAETTIEGQRAAQVAFVPRHSRIKIDGSSPDLTRGYSPLLYGNETRALTVPDFEVRKIHSMKINGTALTQTEIDELQIADNVIWRPTGIYFPMFPYGHHNIEVHYEHGLDEPPAPITRAAILLAREYLLKSELPSRATATSIGDQMFRLTIAGRDGVTGLPEVDAAIDQFGRKGYGIG